MELNKCSRCGVFHANEGDICAKCYNKDLFELSTFTSYIQENGLSSVDSLATGTGISQKNVNRFLQYAGIENPGQLEGSKNSNSGVVFN